MSIKESFIDIFNSIDTKRELLSPSAWSEKNRFMTSEVSTIEGKYHYKYTPYLREIIDTMSPYHPAEIVGIMKGAQLGFTDGLIVNGLLWMIANNPGNCLALSANDTLSKEMVEMRLDSAIYHAGLQHLIKPNTIRKRNQRTGDTSNSKEYAGGRAFFGGMQGLDKLVRQRSIRFGFFDDWDAAPVSDKTEGNLFDLLQLRFSTAAKIMKQYYLSTAKTKPSNIEQVYLKGDQRHWNVPCPKCGALITLKWYELKDNEPTGVYFEKNAVGNLIEKSVGYICQECGQFFKEKHKYEMNLSGIWIPTAEPIRSGIYSYYINNLNAAPFMFNWTHYAHQWVEIYRDGIERKSKLKAFNNQVLGLPWEERKTKIDSKRLQKNIRDYEIGQVPNKLSKDDGNGMIVLLTCAIDCNGTIDDCRLDYDVWAHSETGSVYSINQGSLGTYQPGDQHNEKREKMSYRLEAQNNVWDELWNNILLREYRTDEGNIMKIMLSGIDMGHMTNFVYQFADQYPQQICTLKGDDPDKYYKLNRDLPKFKPATERPNLFILTSDKIKDELAEMILLRWTKGEPQPSGFMNFPSPAMGKYTIKYFEQFESEAKVLEENDDRDVVGYKWKKKSHSIQNHFWDTGYYNLAVRDIVVKKILKELEIKEINWTNFVRVIKKIIED